MNVWDTLQSHDDAWLHADSFPAKDHPCRCMFDAPNMIYYAESTQNMTGLFAGSASSQPFSLDSKSLSPRQVIWNRGRNRWGVEVIQASLAPSFNIFHLWKQNTVVDMTCLDGHCSEEVLVVQSDGYLTSFHALPSAAGRVVLWKIDAICQESQEWTREAVHPSRATDVNWPGFRNKTIWNQAKWQEILSWETWMILNVGTPAWFALVPSRLCLGLDLFTVKHQLLSCELTQWSLSFIGPQTYSTNSAARAIYKRTSRSWEPCLQSFSAVLECYNYVDTLIKGRHTYHI
jgi:hypothetical protein